MSSGATNSEPPSGSDPVQWFIINKSKLATIAASLKTKTSSYNFACSLEDLLNLKESDLIQHSKKIANIREGIRKKQAAASSKAAPAEPEAPIRDIYMETVQELYQTYQKYLNDVKSITLTQLKEITNKMSSELQKKLASPIDKAHATHIQYFQVSLNSCEVAINSRLQSRVNDALLTTYVILEPYIASLKNTPSRMLSLKDGKYDDIELIKANLVLPDGIIDLSIDNGICRFLDNDSQI